MTAADPLADLLAEHDAKAAAHGRVTTADIATRTARAADPLLWSLTHSARPDLVVDALTDRTR